MSLMSGPSASALLIPGAGPFLSFGLQAVGAVTGGIVGEKIVDNIREKYFPDDPKKDKTTDAEKEAAGKKMALAAAAKQKRDAEIQAIYKQRQLKKAQPAGTLDQIDFQGIKKFDRDTKKTRKDFDNRLKRIGR
jgi:hypothetical protein